MKKLVFLTLALIMSLAIMTGCSKKPEEVVELAPGEYVTVGTEDVQTALADSNSVVVDARINSAFIGWTLDGASRGGHIKGATDFSARWLSSTYDDNENLEEMARDEVLAEYLENKGITSEKKVIVYDANGSDAKAVADYFASKGIEDVSLYDVKLWAEDSSLEMVQYSDYELLVPSAHVNALIKGETPESFEEGVDYKLFNVAWGEIDQSGYLEGHVPGSVHVNTDWVEPEELDWMLAPDATLLKLMLKLGLTTQDHVIVTGPEPMATTRFAVILRYMGVEDVRVMTGGLVEWSDLGFELATDDITEAVAVTDFGATAPVNPDLIDTQDEVAAALSSSDFSLIDNRTWEEFIGESSGYSYHDKKGRIPGAVFGYGGRISSSSVSYYRNIDKTMRNADEVLAMWAEQDIDPAASHLSFMCGSGWRSAEILWYSHVMGQKNTSLYSDGWIGWSNAGRPTETGEPAQ